MNPLLEFLSKNPFEAIIALVVLIYWLRGKSAHGMYWMYLLIGVSVAAKSLGPDQFIGGLALGVFANELFRILRGMLEKENKKPPASDVPHIKR